MRVSYEWLKEMVDVPADPQELVAEFVRTGTEVEGVERMGADLDHVVTGQVISNMFLPPLWGERDAGSCAIVLIAA